MTFTIGLLIGFAIGLAVMALWLFAAMGEGL
jgi:hypothetical protein